MAKAFAALMSRLGYPRWGASGGDTGALVGKELGILAPDGLIGIHLLQIFAYPSGDPAEMPKLSEADTKSLSGSTADFQSKAGYQAIQRTRPETLGYGLTDSPVGQLAWNAELWTGWGDYERNNNIVRYTEFDRGGHFAYTTDPDLVVEDLREFFASLS
jgi:epoxide hydrolase